jgi:hypothetical protein
VKNLTSKALQLTLDEKESATTEEFPSSHTGKRFEDAGVHDTLI